MSDVEMEYDVTDWACRAHADGVWRYRAPIKPKGLGWRLAAVTSFMDGGERVCIGYWERPKEIGYRGDPVR